MTFKNYACYKAKLSSLLIDANSAFSVLKKATLCTSTPTVNSFQEPLNLPDAVEVGFHFRQMLDMVRVFPIKGVANALFQSGQPYKDKVLWFGV